MTAIAQRAIEMFTPDFDGPAPVALRGVRLRSDIAALGQRTTIEQTFVNTERRAIEAVYTFPLPENAAVCALEVITCDRVLIGRVEESDKANAEYDRAIRQ